MVIDDHPLVLDGVASWLEEAGTYEDFTWALPNRQSPSGGVLR